MSTKFIAGSSCVGQKAVALLLLMTLLTLPGCGGLDGVYSLFGVRANSSPDTSEGLAMEAMDDFNRGQYSDALATFEEIKERFPFSPSSLLAELKSADCNYYLNHLEEAIALYQEFEANHPTNEAVPYVLFQISMSYYRQIDTIDRDPGAAIDALAAFAKLLKAYPDSPYKEEVRAKRMAARNFLANHEFYVASFYIRSGEIDQAGARLQYLLQNYPDTSVAVEAKEIVAAIDAGNPPERTWRDWIPDISLPDWETFSSLSPVKGGSAPPPGQ